MSCANYTLAILFVVYIFDFVDRQILPVLRVPSKQDLGVSDTATGFLTGAAFALFHTTAVAAIVLFVLNTIRLGPGPWAIGFGNDLLAGRFGDEAIRYMLATAVLFNLWAIGHSLRAARWLPGDLERVG